MEFLNIPIYRVFGINLACELQSAAGFGLPKTEAKEIPEAVMKFGRAPDRFENIIYSDRVVTATPDSILLNIPGVARYLISRGKEIIIDAEPGANDGDIATYAFGTALGTLLYQRGVFVLHGSAVGTTNGAVIFTGEKGAGKSTTASALALRQYDFLSDDVCAVYFDEDSRPVLHPGLTRSKIAADSYQELLHYAPDTEPVSPVLKKYAAPFVSIREPQPLKALCLLEKTENSLSVQKITGAEKLPVLLQNIYRPLIHELTDLPQDRFIQCAKFASAVQFYRATRNEGFASFEAFIDLLEDKFLNV